VSFNKKHFRFHNIIIDKKRPITTKMSDTNAYKFFHEKALRKRNLSENEIKTYIKDVYITNQEGMDMLFFLIYVFSDTEISYDPPFEGLKQNQDSSYTWDFDNFPMLLKKMLVIALKHHKKNAKRHD